MYFPHRLPTAGNMSTDLRRWGVVGLETLLSASVPLICSFTHDPRHCSHCSRVRGSVFRAHRSPWQLVTLPGNEDQ